MADGRDGRTAAGRWSVGSWVDRVLAERAVDIDETYARLEGRHPITLDDALEQLDYEAAVRARRRAHRRARLRSAWSSSWRRVRPRRLARRFRVPMMALAALLLRT